MSEFVQLRVTRALRCEKKIQVSPLCHLAFSAIYLFFHPAMFTFMFILRLDVCHVERLDSKALRP